MKTLACTLALLILSMLVFTNSMAQKSNYTTNGGMTIGFGLGAAYQKSDLVNSRGGGFDFTLGSFLYKKENSFFSLDWKFRFLAGENKAYDHRINADNTYSNIHYRFFSYDLELGLTLNRLRERTRIVVTGFAGAGITHGLTYTDLYDAGNNLYDFSSIDPNRDSKLVYDDLVVLSDGNFETQVNNRAAILPTAGFFIGYQFSRSFSMGIEYKTNFYLTEKNSTVGIDLDNKVVDGSAFDRNSYVGLGFKWNLRGSSSSGYILWEDQVDTQPIPSTTETISTETVTPQTSITEPDVYMPQPVVHIFDPSDDPYKTASSTHTIKAAVRDVSGAENISFYQNGDRSNNFSYNAALKTFTAEVQLREGENTFRILAANQTSTAEDQVIITLDESAAVVEPAAVAELSSPPEIDIISHVNNSVRTFETSSEMRAMVLNVNSKEDITLNINGVNTRDFTFNPSTKILTTNVTLMDGNNTVNISARNESGSDVDDRVFIKENRPCPPPLIKLIDPAREQTNTDLQIYEVWAEVHNIANRNQLGLAVNGKTVPFNFSNNLVSSSVQLINGINTLLLTANNECGEDMASARMTYSPTVVEAPCIPPKVSFTVTDVNRDNASHELRGSISNLEDRAGISLLVNGNANDGFRFVPATGDLNAEFNLTPGLHTIILSVRNDCGTDNMGVNVNMEEPCLPPKVSFTVNEVNREKTSHELRGSVSGVSDKSGISLSVDGRADDGFRFEPQTGNLNAQLKLTPGSHRVNVSVSNACGADNQDVSVIMGEPCIAPKVSFSVNEVNRENVSHELGGSISNVTDKADITLVVDGSADNEFQFDPTNGDLSARLKLTPGSHTIIVAVNNACGSDNQGITVLMEEPCIPPRVSFTVNKVNRNDASHELRGSVSNVTDRAGISLTVNGSADNRFQFAPATGDLNGSFKLTPGSHTLAVSVNNACGTDNQEVIVNIEEPCIPPRVSISVNEVNRSDASHELNGSVSNMKNKTGITLTIDGRADYEFRFDPATGALSAEYLLTPGPHIIVVLATNACGSDQQGVNINIEEPCIPPKVSFTVNEVNRVETSHELKGSISNVTDRAGISLTINGRTDDSFQFVPESGDLSAGFKLSPGAHAISVSVNNACGSDKQDVSIIIEEPCIPPKLSITVNEVNREDASHELRGSISNVMDRASISLTINGSPDNNFQFVPTTGDLKAKFKLSPGSHTIVVSVNNACGTDMQEVKVNIEEPCIPPKVSFTINEVDLDETSHELSGSVSNVTDRAGISLTLNGNAEDGFQYVPETGVLKIKFKLIPGAHTIVVSVTNACGTDKQDVSIIVEEPCIPPKVSFTVGEINREDGTHELSGSISNVKNKADISLTIDDSAEDGFQFVPATGVMNARFRLTPGSHTIVVSVKNTCGSDKQDVSVIVEEPCLPPKVSFTITEVNRDDASHELSGLISNVKNKSDISLTVNGGADDGFQFVPASGDMNAKFKLPSGTHMIVVSVTNACGTDNQGVSVIIDEPCILPRVSFTVSEVNRDETSHELSGTISNVKNKADISLSVDGSPDDGFQFVPSSGDMNAKFKLTPGSHTIVVSANNECGTDSKSETFSMEEEACGVRINPGNSSWQFCMETPSGTYSRDDLTNESFSYSGPASSLYIMPIGGGGDVIVNGSPYSIRSGQYYLFTGNLDVTVSTKNPGSMGHWSVCITADREPESGNGNKRPKSPCEEEDDDDDDDNDDDDDDKKGKGKGNK